MRTARAAAWAAWAVWICNLGRLAVRHAGEWPDPESAGKHAESPAQAGLSYIDATRSTGQGLSGVRPTQ
jgi:hypothetical protein